MSTPEQQKDQTTPKKPELYKKIVQKVSKGSLKNLPSFTEILQENNKFLFHHYPKKVNSPKKKIKKKPLLKKKESLNISPTQNQKRFSASIRELDYNTYRAYKMSVDDQKNNILNHNKSTNEILNNQHNISKVPFGLKSKRFDWQTDIERNFLDELYGNTKNYNKRKNSENWDDFVNKINKSENKNEYNIENNISRNRKNNYAHTYSTIANLNSKRTLQPQRDIIPDMKKKPSKKVIYRCSSTGSIINLFNRTPNIKTIPINYNITKGHNLFSDEFSNRLYYKREKGSVDLDKFKKNGYAGSTKANKSVDDFLYNNNNNNYHIKERIKRERDQFINEKMSRNSKLNDENNIVSYTNRMKHSKLMKIKNNISDIFFLKGGKEKIFRNFQNNLNGLTFTFNFSQNQF